MNSNDGGTKHDEGKPDLSLISYELLEDVARVRMFGAKKYARDNWKKGFKVTRSCAAALRHIYQFLSGETLDPESGLPALAHAVCALEHAIYDMKRHPENDDRTLSSAIVADSTIVVADSVSGSIDCGVVKFHSDNY